MKKLKLSKRVVYTIPLGVSFVTGLVGDNARVEFYAVEQAKQLAPLERQAIQMVYRSTRYGDAGQKILEVRGEMPSDTSAFYALMHQDDTSFIEVMMRNTI